MFMTVFEYDPQWTVKDNGTCCSVDRTSLWCIMLSECIYEYEGKFSNGTAGVKFCRWPLSAEQFKRPWYKEERKGFKVMKNI
jgi:hypothetical protein